MLHRDRPGERQRLTITGKQTTRPTVTGRSNQRGQAILELTLVTPLLILLIVLAVNYGAWLYAWAQVGNAARAAANYAILGAASAGSPQTPKAAALQSMIATDLGTLPNFQSSTNPVVAVCWNNNGTVTSITGTCSSPPSDPESASYIAISVDLTYTYSPLIPTFTFANLGIGLPVMPTTIHRRVVMRYI